MLRRRRHSADSISSLSSVEGTSGEWGRNVAARMHGVLRDHLSRSTPEESPSVLISEAEANDHATQKELIEKLSGDAELEEMLSNKQEPISERPADNKTQSSSKVDTFIDDIVLKIHQQWKALIYAVFPMHQIQTLIIVCLVQYISVGTLLKAVPIIACYLSFGAMIYHTLKMFQNKPILKEPMLWKRLLSVFSNRHEEQGSAESEERDAVKNSQYTMVSWDPYLDFFVSLLIFLLSLGAAEKNLPNCVLFFGISLLFSFICFIALADDSDRYAMIAMIGNFISCLPAIMQKMGISFGYLKIWKPFIQVKFSFIRFAVGIPSLALFVVPVAFVFMIIKRRYSDTFHSVVPHIVCLLWSDVAVTLWLIGFRQFHFLGFLLFLAVLSLFAFPSLMGAALAISILFAQINVSVDLMNLVKLLFAIFIPFLPFFCISTYKYVARRCNFRVLPSLAGRSSILLICGYACSLLVAVPLLYQGNLAFGVSEEVTNMTWAKFNKHCASWSSNAISKQIECSELKGTAVNWKGTVQSVRIVGIDNSFETLLDYLPDALDQIFRCFYDTDKSDITHRSGVSPNQCSLTSHNVYSLEIELSGPYGEHYISSNKGQLILSASNAFTEMLKLLDEGDVVRFIGYFDQYPIFRYPPKLRLLQLECLTCRQLLNRSDLKHLRIVGVKPNRRNFWSRILFAFKFLFNFIFAPILSMPN